MKNSLKKSLNLFICLTCLFVLHINCSSDSEEKDSVNTAKSITIADFQVTVPDFPSDEIEEEINDQEIFFNNEPGGAGGDEEEDECIDNYIASAKARKLDNVFYEISIPDSDISDCLGPGAIFSMYFLIQLLNSSGDPIDLSGYTLEQLDTLQSDISEYSILIKFYLNGFFQENGIDYEYVGKTLESSTADPAQPCVHGIDPDIIDGCTNYDLELLKTSPDPEPEPTNLSIFEFINLTESDSGTYYTNGNIDFSINDWDGTMTYHATDTETAPNYTVTNGTTSFSGPFSYNFKTVKPLNIVNIGEKIKNKIRYRINKLVK